MGMFYMLALHRKVKALIDIKSTKLSRIYFYWKFFCKRMWLGFIVANFMINPRR